MSTKKKLKLAIVGHGFVGKAMDWGFDISVEKYIVDPNYNSSVSDLSKFKPDMVFICVPTPMGSDGSQDSSIIKAVIKDLNKYCSSAIKIIKSTVLPSVLDGLNSIENNLVYNPEFLREKHANKDFINSNVIILGGDKDITRKVSRAYLNHSKCKTKEHIFTDIKSASLIKYAINTFLASKVIFFNELHNLFENAGVSDSWQDIIGAISKDERIGESHMNVPGHDGRKGFGGACFPKDSLALVKYADENQCNLKVLKAVIKSNNKIRKQYDDLESRETEQNVSFDDKI